MHKRRIVPTRISANASSHNRPGRQPESPLTRREVRVAKAVGKRLNRGDPREQILDRYGPNAGRTYQRFVFHHGPLPRPRS